jgi:hypothetical protein
VIAYFFLRWFTAAVHYISFFSSSFILRFFLDITSTITCDGLDDIPVDEPGVSPLKDSPQFSDATLLTIAALSYIVAGCSLYFIIFYT